MSEVFRRATFDPRGSRAEILDDLACPVCGLQDPLVTVRRPTENRLRLFCEGCGAFVTILLDDDQAATLLESRG